jgi:hypothetical protein
MSFLRALVLLISLGSSLLVLPHGTRADALRRIERETKREQPSRHSAPSRSGSWSRSRSVSHSHYRHHHRSDSDGSSVGPKALMVFLLFPWSTPHLALEWRDDPQGAEERGCLKAYAPYPFADGPGLLRKACDEEPAKRKHYALGLSGESGFMLQGVVPASFAMRLLLPSRVELSARTDWLHDVESDTADRALMTTAHFVYRFAQSKHADFRTGLGPRRFRLEDGRWGFDVLYAIDVYGRRPFVFRVELHTGALGDSWVAQARSTLGGMLGRVELYAGYDHTYLSDGRGSGARLGGPVAGARAWF